MDPATEFEALFNEAYNGLRALQAATGQPVSPAITNVLGLTVSELNAVVQSSKAALQAIPTDAIQALLPFVLPQLPPDGQQVLQALADQNYAVAFAPLDAAFAQVSGGAPNVLVGDVLLGIDGGGTDGGDGGTDGGTDGGDGGTDGGDGGVDNAAAIAQLLATLETELANLLWTETAGEYRSPTFTVSDVTGGWTTTGTEGTPLTGTSLEELYEQIGDGVARAIMSYVSTQQDILDEANGSGATAADFSAATAAIETAAAQAFELLQDIGTSLTERDDVDALALGANADTQAQAFGIILENALASLRGEFDGLMLGSRNSDPAFVVSPEGTSTGSEHDDWFYLSQSSDTFDGGLGEDVIFAVNGNDTVTGGEGADWLYGGAGADSLSGGADDDYLVGGAGNDQIDGGEGTGDVAAFDGPMGRYVLQLSNDGSVVVQDRSQSGEGRDTVTNVETLAFASGATIFEDGNLDLSIIQGITTLDETQIATFIELYIAYFNRAPDALGLYFWGSAFANGVSLEEIATLFLDQDETRATYPEDETNLDFATQVYANVLGRIPDQDGLDFWVGALDSGAVGRDQFILQVLIGAKADPQEGASQEFIDLQLADRAYLADKTDIGTYFAVTNGLSDVADASAAMQLYVRGDDSSIQTAVAEIDNTFAAAFAEDSGELILQLVGVADDPFAV